MTSALIQLRPSVMPTALPKKFSAKSAAKPMAVLSSSFKIQRIGFAKQPDDQPEEKHGGDDDQNVGE